MILQVLLNKWFFTFIIGWAAFLALIDLREVRKNIWGGIITIGLELWQDNFASAFDNYHMKDIGISFLYVSTFFTFGIAFTMGTIFMQFMPRNPRLQLLHIMAFAFGFLIFETTAKMFGMLIETHWSLVGSLFDNIVIFGGLTWVKYYIQYKSKAG